MDSEEQGLIEIAELTFDQLRGALEGFPDGKLGWSPSDGVMSPRRQIAHACSADRRYANCIDGGSRRADCDLDRELRTGEDLTRLLEETREMTVRLIRSVEDLDRPVDIAWHPGASVRFVLMHMLRHKHYHTGQLTLLLRLIG